MANVSTIAQGLHVSVIRGHVVAPILASIGERILKMEWTWDDNVLSETSVYIADDGELYELCLTPLKAGGVDADVLFDTESDVEVFRQWYPTYESAKQAVVKSAATIAARVAAAKAAAK